MDTINDIGTIVDDAVDETMQYIVFEQTNNGNRMFYTENLGDFVIFRVPLSISQEVYNFPEKMLKYMGNIYLDFYNDMETDCTCCSKRWNDPIFLTRKGLSRLILSSSESLASFVIHSMDKNGELLDKNMYKNDYENNEFVSETFELEIELLRRSQKQYDRDYGVMYPYVLEKIRKRWEELEIDECYSILSKLSKEKEEHKKMVYSIANQIIEKARLEMVETMSENTKYPVDILKNISTFVY